jgi:hypothetical protein
MKNIPDLAQLQTSYLSSEIEKRTVKSCETIPLISIDYFKMLKASTDGYSNYYIII